MAVNEASAAPWGMFGQDAAVAALQQALDSDRLAHAYLFTGPDGVGKGTLARRLVAALLCEAAPDARPCLECRACRRVEAGETPDVERIAIGGVCDEGGPAHRDHAADGSTRIRICQVRRLERVASLTPFQAPRRIFILDTADDLQREAAHALLKTLEEPPSSVLLILLATDVDELLPTVRSRCQELALRPMPDAALIAALRQRPGLDPETAGELAAEAHGRYGLAMRLHTDPSLRMLRETAEADALRLASAGRNERFDYAATIAARWSRERAAVLDTLDAWRWWWRARLLEASRGEPGPVRCTPAEAVRALQAVTTTREHLLANTNPQLALEVMMLDLPVLAAPPEDPREETREAVAPAQP
ncbi:MAG: DNA polymerase III subunit delta' [Dehalococcoidia bacterium]